MEETTAQLKSLDNLFKASFNIYRQRIVTFLVLGVLTIVIAAVSGGVLFGAGFGLSMALPASKNVLISVLSVIGVLFIFCISAWGLGALLISIVDQKADVKTCFGAAKPMVGSFLWLFLLIGFLTTGAFLFLIIPGILFTVWFFVAPFVLAAENKRGMKALLKSKAYVRGYWLPVFVRVLVIYLLSMVLSLVPFVGPFLSLLFFPFFFIYAFVMYEDLKKIQEGMRFEPTFKSKFGIFATGTLGFAVPVVVMIFFMGSMFWAIVGGFTSSGMIPSLLNLGNMPTMQSAKATPVPENQSVLHKKKTKKISKKTKKQPRKTTKAKVAKKKKRVRKAPQNKPMIAKSTAPSAPVRQVAKKNKKKMQPVAAPASVNTLPVQGITTKPVSQRAVDTSNLLADEPLLPDESLADHGQPELPDQAAKPLMDLALADTEPEEMASSLDLEQNVKKISKQSQPPIKSEKYWLEKGALCSVYGNYRAAITHFRKSIEINPSNSSAYYNLGVSYGEMGEYDAAITAFNNALAIVPENGLYYYGRGRVYLLAANRDKAIDDFQQAASLGNADAQTYLASNQ